jgi:bifunctional polynucleotide phosphatase/kinase
VNSKFKYSQTVAIFSLIGTLIKCKSHRYLYDNIEEKIKEIDDGGGSIIIFDSFKTSNLDDLKHAVELLEKNTCPLAVFFSTDSNKYSKPFTGMWDIMEIMYKNKNKIINKNVSMMIGNKAGRITIKHKLIDYSCSDRAFAHNVGIKFTTPERFFLNDQKFRLWEWNSKILDTINRKAMLSGMQKIQLPVISQHIESLRGLDKSQPKKFKCMVIITGSPSCGKTTLAQKIKRKWGVFIEIISINTPPDKPISDLNNIDDALKSHKSIVVDITAHSSHITKIIEVAMKNLTPILVVEIQTTQKLAQLLNFIKVQTSNNCMEKILPAHNWKKYYAQYIKPDYKGVPCVKYLEFPLVIKPSDAYWYEYVI